MYHLAQDKTKFIWVRDSDGKTSFWINGIKKLPCDPKGFCGNWGTSLGRKDLSLEELIQLNTYTSRKLLLSIPDPSKFNADNYPELFT